ncbi:MAG: N-acetylmuramic acid 6-phosphate etherase [Cyclobacteriaceae bacterium]
MSTTESSSLYDKLESMPVGELLKNINNEDQKVATVVAGVLPEVERLVNGIVPRMQKGGRLFYIGAGTSGRLGILDASECPPTFGVPHGMVVGLIAGGDKAIRKAAEFAEDDENQAWLDLQEHEINESDCVVGIAASGRTPYVIGGIREARKQGLFTGCITCNKGSALAKAAEYPIEVIVGPEFVTGSTRMKAGTAQKMVLNMISTATMIRLGRVKGNKMVDMQLSNNKLIQRGVNMLMEELGINKQEAQSLLAQHGSVRKVIDSLRDA